MLEIDAINRIIRAAGQVQANSTTDPNAAVAKNVLARERRRLLAGGFAFNTDKIVVQVNTSGRVPVSSEFLKIRFRDGDGHLDTRKESGTRYIWNLNEGTWHDQDTELEVVFDMPFADIPENFGQWISDYAAKQHWGDVNPNGRINQRLEREEQTSHAVAINSLEPGRMNVHGATGWRGIQRIAPSVNHFNGRWIGLE